MCTQEVKTNYLVRGLKLQDTEFVEYLNEQHAWWPLPVIIMEYCNGGDVRSHLQKFENLNGLIEFEICEIMRCLRHAIEYLHNKCKIQHRDLKPDNIVRHCEENGRVLYKLTDFGFARSINENTALQSVVGTRNYFAPEVIDTAKYKETTDYWSMGVIAFELMCGILPFIPHQDLFHIIVNIKKKPKDCIAITQALDDEGKAQRTSDDNFIFCKHIFAENRMSNVLRLKMENWLRLALDSNYQTRGSVSEKSGLVLKLYTDLDEILDCKILTVFCLNSYKFYAYEINENQEYGRFLADLEMDTNITKENFYFILPTSHPRSLLEQTVKKPFDLFVNEWRDQSNKNNPPVMLYLFGVGNDFQNMGEPHVSDVIRHCLRNELLPKWQSQKFAEDIHFMIANEQKLLETFVKGLEEFALMLEHEIFIYNCVKLLLNEILMIHGYVQQFDVMISNGRDCVGKQCDSKRAVEILRKWQMKAEAYKSDITKIRNEAGPKIEKRYNSAYRRIKEQATSDDLKNLLDIEYYRISEFREHLESAHKPHRSGNSFEKIERCQTCFDKVYECADARKNFLDNITMKRIRTTIIDVKLEFRKIKKTVDDCRKFLFDMEKKLETSTAQFFKETFELYGNRNANESNNNNNNNNKNNQLKPDGELPAALNDFALSSLDNMINVPSEPIIRSVNQTLEKLATLAVTPDSS